MSFSEKTIRTLEFDKICAMLEEHASTEGAKVMARNLRPTDDTYTVLRRLRRTTDARRLADAKGAPSFGRIRDISAACERAEKGAILSPRELLDCANVLRTARILQAYSSAGSQNGKNPSPVNWSIQMTSANMKLFPEKFVPFRAWQSGAWAKTNLMMADLMASNNLRRKMSAAMICARC